MEKTKVMDAVQIFGGADLKSVEKEINAAIEALNATIINVSITEHNGEVVVAMAYTFEPD